MLLVLHKSPAKPLEIDLTLLLYIEAYLVYGEVGSKSIQMYFKILRRVKQVIAVNSPSLTLVMALTNGQGSLRIL